MRGFGYSGGVRKNCRIRHFIADLHLVVQQCFDDLPLYFYGHSLGALVAFYYLLLNRIKVAGVVFSAPLLTIPTSWRLTKLKMYLLDQFGTMLDVIFIINFPSQFFFLNFSSQIFLYNFFPKIFFKIYLGIDHKLKPEPYNFNQR